MVAWMCASGGISCRNRVPGKPWCASRGRPAWRTGLCGIAAVGRRGLLFGRGKGNRGRVGFPGCMRFPS
eukprot:scaffold189111_cov50-Attheya_sp.AAC.1